MINKFTNSKFQQIKFNKTSLYIYKLGFNIQIHERTQVVPRQSMYIVKSHEIIRKTRINWC